MVRFEQVWVFCGSNSLFPSGVFTELGVAERWIKGHLLSGTLTAYPIDTGIYEWAIDQGDFRPTKPHQTTPTFIQKFTSASMEHYHFKNGERLI